MGGVVLVYYIHSKSVSCLDDIIAQNKSKRGRGRGGARGRGRGARINAAYVGRGGFAGRRGGTRGRGSIVRVNKQSDMLLFSVCVYSEEEVVPILEEEEEGEEEELDFRGEEGSNVSVGVAVVGLRQEEAEPDN